MFSVQSILLTAARSDFLVLLPSCSKTYWFHHGCWVESKLSGWPSQTPTVWSPLLCQHSPPLSAFLSFYPQPHHLNFVPRIPQAQAAPRPLFTWFPLPSAFFLHTCLSKSSKTSNSIASKKCSGGFSVLLGRGPSLPASHLTIYCINTLWSGLFRNVYLPYQTLILWRTLFAFLLPLSTGAEKTVDLNWGRGRDGCIPCLLTTTQDPVYAELETSAYLRFPQLRPPSPNGQLQINRGKEWEFLSNLKSLGNLLSNF